MPLSIAASHTAGLSAEQTHEFNALPFDLKGLKMTGVGYEYDYCGHMFAFDYETSGQESVKIRLPSKEDS